jgi:hypothetical protein
MMDKEITIVLRAEDGSLAIGTAVFYETSDTAEDLVAGLGIADSTIEYASDMIGLTVVAAVADAGSYFEIVEGR